MELVSQPKTHFSAGFSREISEVILRNFIVMDRIKYLTQNIFISHVLKHQHVFWQFNFLLFSAI